jgi:outer membrane protein, multidrug efflux system
VSNPASAARNTLLDGPVKSIIATLPGLAGAALCAACAATAPHGAAPPTMPTAYTEATTATAGTGDDSGWYGRFSSSELNTLLEAVPAGNVDLAAASARVRQAAARARGVHATLMPQLDVTGSATRFAGRSGGTSASETDWSALLSASYEFDFWGRNRASFDASTAMARASVAGRATVLLTTRAALANSYFTVLSLRERQSIAQHDLDAAREILKVIEARHAAGFASNADLASQRALVAATEVVIPDLQGQQQAAIAALAALAGRDPEGFAVQATGLADLAEPAIDAGLPSSLLHRRPDILAAEANLAAADADLAAARAAMFPTIALTASGGVQSPAMQAAVTTLAGTGPTLVIGASLLQAVFDGGRRRALRDEASARAEELLANYQGAIRNALVDVEAALAARRSLNAQQAARAQVLEQSQLAFDAARARYVAGSGDSLTLLGAQRTLQAARDADAQYRLARLQALVNLARALGGGWQDVYPERK